MGVVKSIKGVVNKAIASYANSFFGDAISYLGESVSGRFKWTYRKIKDKILTSFGYATNADVYSIVSMIAYKMSEIPIAVKKMSFKGDYLLDEESEVYKLLHEDFRETYKEKIIKASINLNLTGDLFLQKIYFNDAKEFPDRLEVLRSSDVHLQTDSENQITKILYCDYRENRYIDYDDIIHIKLYDPNSSNDLRGLSPLQAGYQALDASNDIQTASSKIYKNLGASWLVSDKSGTLRTAEEAKKLQNALNNRIGGPEKAGQVTVTSVDAGLQQIGMSPKDMELIKSQPIKLRQMCNLFGVDSSFFNDPANKTFNNRKEAEKALVNNGCKPKLELIISSIEREINKVRTIKLEPQYHVLDCLQEDQREEAEKNKIVSEGIQNLLEGSLTDKQKELTLIKTWKYTEEEAKEMVYE